MAIQGVSGNSAQVVVYGSSTSVVQAARREKSGARAEKEESARSQSQQLSAEEQRQVRDLQATDSRVRAHEQAHIAAGGGLVEGGATFTYATGPDDKRYAVAGEVSIDTSPGRTPEETIPKAQRIRDAALAPADPSPQDRSVAAAATQMEGNARAELSAQRRSEAQGKDEREGAGLYLGVEKNGRPSLGRSLNVFA
ncbi:MAG: putative metalloprotease CJM1_0395 family protein [Propionivibrio sp.]